MKIFLATPYFNNRERDVADRLWSVLTSCGYDVYFFAKKGFVLSPNSAPHLWKRAFDEDVERVEWCDIMVANIERDPDWGIDSGTVFELACAWRSGKPVIAYDETPGKKLNVMLAIACHGYSTNEKELVGMIEGDARGWTGLVI